jgi:hypothetical protein
MYVKNSSKKRKYLVVKLFGTRLSDRSLYLYMEKMIARGHHEVNNNLHEDGDQLYQ